MKIAVLGTGKVGSALGSRLAAAGHRVVYGSRSRAGGPGVLGQHEAVASADVVITAIPGTSVVNTLEQIGEQALGDKIVLDPSAAFSPQMTMAYPGDSVAQQVQARFPRLRVVKTLNTMNFTIMVDPLASLPRATAFVSGYDEAAKKVVRGLLADLGWPDDAVLDLGGVDTALATEHVAPLFFATVRALGTAKFNISITSQA